jgi:hypothetical protein
MDWREVRDQRGALVGWTAAHKGAVLTVLCGGRWCVVGKVSVAVGDAQGESEALRNGLAKDKAAQVAAKL